MRKTAHTTFPSLCCLFLLCLLTFAEIEKSQLYGTCCVNIKRLVTTCEMKINFNRRIAKQLWIEFYAISVRQRHFLMGFQFYYHRSVSATATRVYSTSCWKLWSAKLFNGILQRAVMKIFASIEMSGTPEVHVYGRTNITIRIRWQLLMFDKKTYFCRLAIWWSFHVLSYGGVKDFWEKNNRKQTFDEIITHGTEPSLSSPDSYL